MAGSCARQIAVQGVGYNPLLIAVQGIGPCAEQPPVEPPVVEGVGGRGGFWYWSRLARWKPQELAPARTVVFPPVVQYHHIAPATGRGRNQAFFPSVHTSAQVAKPSGYSILTGTCGPVSQKHRISRVGGKVDVTRMEEEVLAMLLAEMEEDE